jgi:ABC-type uncharacterized transport system YnjBCD ATPase subunit
MTKSRVPLSEARVGLAYQAALLLLVFSVGAVFLVALTSTIERQEAPDEAGMIPVAAER